MSTWIDLKLMLNQTRSHALRLSLVLLLTLLTACAVSAMMWRGFTMGWTRTKSDQLGRVVEVETFGPNLPQPWGSNSTGTGKVQTAYDAEFTTVTDQANKVRRSMVDGLGRLIRVDEPDNGGALGSKTSPVQPTSYTYDALNNLLQVSQGAQTRTFNYSSLSRLTSAANPESGTISYGYDDNGNLTSRTDARSVTTTITYDALNRSVSRSYSGGVSTPHVNYYYDNQTLPSGAPSYTRGFAKGRLVAVTYGGGSEGNYFGYDELGRVNIKYQRTGTTNYSISASYNKFGGMTGETYPSSRTVSYSFDDAGRLTSFSGTLGDGTSRTYATIGQYNAAGQRERESYGTGANGMTTPLYLKLHYNRRQQMVDLRLGSVNDEWDLNRGALVFYYGTNAMIYGNPFLDDTDNNGNLLRQWTYAPKAGGGTVTPQLADYTYDSLNRVTSFVEGQINESGSFVPNVATQTFSYDRYGNRCATSSTSGLSNYCPSYTATNNRINGLSYDAAGNITYDAMSGGTLTYDAENRLVTAGSVGTYAYDGEGKRVKRLANGQEWRYVYGIGGELIAEYLSTAPTTVKKEYGYRGGQMLVVWDADKSGDERLKWLIQDHLGSTRMEADKSGSLSAIKRHDYAPFGEEMAAGIRQSGGVGQYGYEPPQTNVRQKFTGYEKDGETGLDFAQARHFSNLQGRFTSVDPALSSGKPALPQSWNRYSYVLNAPLVFIDPSGLIWGTKSGESHIKWFNTREELDSAGYEVLTQFVYEVGGTWYAIDPNSNRYKPATHKWDATREYWAFTGLPPSFQDWIPVWGQFRRGMFNYATRNYEGAIGNFALASLEGGTSATAINFLGRGAAGRAFATEPGKAVFWSGAPEAEAAALEFAGSIGGKTLETTLGGKVLNFIDSPRLWEWGSRKFAEGATDKVNVFLRQDFSPAGVWSRIERPILEQRGVKIIEHSVAKSKP